MNESSLTAGVRPVAVPAAGSQPRPQRAGGGRGAGRGGGWARSHAAKHPR